MTRTLLIFFALLVSLMPNAVGIEPDKFINPTGIPFSGFVGETEPEMMRLRLHFELSDAQAAALRESISTHRESWERMYALYEGLVVHQMERGQVSGGIDEMHEAHPDMGPLVIAKHTEIMEAQSLLEGQLIDRIRSIIDPSDNAVWQDYLMTRDFERWRQPSWHETLGETIDPLLLLERVDPVLVDNPDTMMMVRELRHEAHSLAATLVVAYQRKENHSMRWFNRIEALDDEEGYTLKERADVAAFELATFLWKIPDRIDEGGYKNLDARAYRESFTAQQGLVRGLNGLPPIEDRIGGALFVRWALELPDLSQVQRDAMQSIWAEMQSAYDRAWDLDHQWNDQWMRTGTLDETPEYPEQVRQILRQAGKGPDEIASILTLPQWYALAMNSRHWGRKLHDFHPEYERFDWWSLDFEVLIPE